MTHNCCVSKLFWLCTLFLLSLACTDADPLPNIAFSHHITIVMMPINRGQREAYDKMISAFKVQAPDIKVSVKVYEHEQFKALVERGEYRFSESGDVYFWFGGIRLNSLAMKGDIADLTELWHERGWSERFTAAAEGAVTANNMKFAVPINYYQWGVYYRQSAFDARNLASIETWEDLLNACEAFSGQGRALFTVGTRSPWSVAGWFDYLNLRINGLAFHQDLMRGDASYDSPRVHSVFVHWKEALDAGCFIDSRHEMSWKDALPLMYHDRAAAVLMGNFFVSDVPLKIQDDLLFVPFPVINPKVPSYEDAPVDVLVVSKQSEGDPAVSQFLSFIVESDVLIEMNQTSKKLSPFRQPYELDNKFMKAGDQLLKNAKGVAQFFDRDTPPEMAKPAMDLMVMFMNEELTIDEVIYSLEQYRMKVFDKSPVFLP
ncbi:ABC transporter substrate-binding protein [Litoribacillus peritrichatus]|uniref:Extracellular solute-binding protein n=1 Tax=Litoribacillus peritrichatus TaxID=718191 RepID=A0ABP7M906_9GAMM